MAPSLSLLWWFLILLYLIFKGWSFQHVFKISFLYSKLFLLPLTMPHFCPWNCFIDFPTKSLCDAVKCHHVSCLSCCFCLIYHALYIHDLVILGTSSLHCFVLGFLRKRGTLKLIRLSVTKTEVLMIEHWYLAYMILVTSPFIWHHAITSALTLIYFKVKVVAGRGPQFLLVFVLLFQAILLLLDWRWPSDFFFPL